MTLAEAVALLKNLDEITLLEVLDISSEDIINRFEDLIVEKLDDIEEDLEELYPNRTINGSHPR